MEYIPLCIARSRKNAKYFVRHNICFLSDVQVTCFELINESFIMHLFKKHSKNQVMICQFKYISCVAITIAMKTVIVRVPCQGSKHL
jgi:hypothetical protein